VWRRLSTSRLRLASLAPDPRLQTTLHFEHHCAINFSHWGFPSIANRRHEVIAPYSYRTIQTAVRLEMLLAPVQPTDAQAENQSLNLPSSTFPMLLEQRIPNLPQSPRCFRHIKISRWVQRRSDQQAYHAHIRQSPPSTALLSESSSEQSSYFLRYRHPFRIPS
jgi:hypothetical protein